MSICHGKQHLDHVIESYVDAAYLIYIEHHMTITGSLNNPEYMILMLSLHAPSLQITSFLLATSLFSLCPHLTVAYIYDIQIILCQYISCIQC